MSFPLNPAAFVENGPVLTAAASAQRRSSAASYGRLWKSLDAHRRLALVEELIRAA